MADLNEIKRIARIAAQATMPGTDIVDIDVQSDLSVDGEDMVRIRLVVPDDQANHLDFANLFTAIVQIKDDVRRTGDDRRTSVSYITPTELTYHADPED
ncbi:hypothetical protein [Sphingomonas sp. CLY1604]|uniref:hypothetical protein n=1 Tax=Sphingomonas sp. CLY1604 TaxID=3457786 RepID=UPI003FD6C9EA